MSKITPIRCQEEVSRSKRSYQGSKSRPTPYSHPDEETHQCKFNARYLIKNDPAVVAGKGISSVSGITFNKDDRFDQIPDNVKSMLVGFGTLAGQNPSNAVQSVKLSRS